MKVVVALALMPVAAFCLFGFLASFENTPGAIYFRLGYGVVGIACVAAISSLVTIAVLKRAKSHA